MLEDRHTTQHELILSPAPSDDPDGPLARKAVNYGLTFTFVLFTFVLVDVKSLAYKGYIKELDLTYTTFNLASASNFLGFAIWWLLLIPCVHKFGRCPIYFMSAVVQVVYAAWWANFYHAGELIAVSLLSGLAISISEAVMMNPIIDLFFIHQDARMNEGPIAAGYVVVDQGWRWMWWIVTILLGVNFILVLFFFEASKYIPALDGRPQLPRRSIRQRLAFVNTDIPLFQHFYQPVIALFFFPAVAYTAVTYRTALAFFSASCSAGSYFLIYLPYNFNASAIGLFHLGGFKGFPAALLNYDSMLIYGIEFRRVNFSISYILADALIAVVFLRNGFAAIIRFAFTDWLAGMGIENTLILISMTALASIALPIF
ncbi:uncharacterized protein BDW43DRAFT_297121 [Aspergillus alliaceus]|uniref:uncharacterized protein n=1 Tax=Petromyces alliaceus TaxID=209559 RepID=UPI0012A4E588|nr:uncharacterized protein BDW43DRAFT_297121 [Aspergillus alliaceus]KAB8238200.1 hypothetical protein BDW43DRAFT_297121 [Aspergillus alliaceus]